MRLLDLTRPQQFEELADIFYDVAKDDDTDVVILTGAHMKEYLMTGDLMQAVDGFAMGRKSQFK